MRFITTIVLLFIAATSEAETLGIAVPVIRCELYGPGQSGRPYMDVNYSLDGFGIKFYNGDHTEQELSFIGDLNNQVVPMIVPDGTCRLTSLEGNGSGVFDLSCRTFEIANLEIVQRVPIQGGYERRVTKTVSVNVGGRFDLATVTPSRYERVGYITGQVHYLGDDSLVPEGHEVKLFDRQSMYKVLKTCFQLGL